MQIIYRPENLTEAHIIASLLESKHIKAHVGGHYLQGGIGNLPASELATVYVDEKDIERAKAIIADYENKPVIKEPDTSRNSLLLTLTVIVISILLILFFAVTYSN